MKTNMPKEIGARIINNVRLEEGKGILLSHNFIERETIDFFGLEVAAMTEAITLGRFSRMFQI